MHHFMFIIYSIIQHLINDLNIWSKKRRCLCCYKGHMLCSQPEISNGCRKAAFIVFLKV